MEEIIEVIIVLVVIGLAAYGLFRNRLKNEEEYWLHDYFDTVLCKAHLTDLFYTSQNPVITDIKKMKDDDSWKDSHMNTDKKKALLKKLVEVIQILWESPTYTYIEQMTEALAAFGLSLSKYLDSESRRERVYLSVKMKIYSRKAKKQYGPGWY